MQIVFADSFYFFALRNRHDPVHDKCVSFVVLAKAGITEALTGDHHFEQVGFVALLK